MFEKSEYIRRLENLQTRICESGLDALLVGTDSNITYLTGVSFESVERHVLMVVPPTGTPSLIVPRMEQEQLSAAVTVPVGQIVVYWELDAAPGRGWEEALCEVLGSAKSVGIDPFSSVEITQALAGRQWQVSELVEDIRVIKSRSEVDWIRRVASYWNIVMNSMLKKAGVGVSIGDLLAEADKTISSIVENEPVANWLNTQPAQFFQCAPMSGSPHYFSYRTDQKLPDGPSIINVIGDIAHYKAENERTILTGHYTAEHAELFDLMRGAQKLALELIKPGVACAEVDFAVQNFFQAEGVASHMRHRVGHGFGLLCHERPYTSEGSKEFYEPNMVISVEPGLYVDGLGGFRHSDTVLITNNGIENFTAAVPKDRECLTF